MIWLISGETSTIMLVYLLIFSKKPIILSRIDFWLVPSYLSPFIKSDIKHLIKKEYSVILLNINSALHANRGPGFWKFNASLLEDICFVNHIRENQKKIKRKIQRSRR